MRISSISLAGIALRPGGRDSAASVRSTSSDGAGERAPVHQPALDDPERVEALLHRVLRQHELRRAVRGAQHAVEPLQHPRQPLLAAQQRRRPLEELRVRCLVHPPIDLLYQCLAGTRLLEMRERHVELAPVRVRVEVAEARRHAAAHLPVRRRVLAHLQLAPAVAQPVERRELVGELARQRTAAERPHVHGMPRRRLVRHLEHGIGDVEAAAQVAVAVRALQLHVPGGLPLLDQPVLEHERAELRVGRPVVHDLARARSSPRARRSAPARASAATPTSRRTAAARARRGRRRRPGRRAAWRGRGAGRAGSPRPARSCERGGASAAGRARRRPSRRSRTASGTARRTRART